MLFIDCDKLTPDEKKFRHELIYLFNPCLKFLFNQHQAFREYAYNSCRQTAIFSAEFLKWVGMPGRFDVYEGNFTDVIYGQKTKYVHAFVIAVTAGRKLLIDVSRTQRKLLFEPVDKIEYPKHEGYENLKLIDYQKMDIEPLINTDIPEFITGKLPAEVMQEALILYNELKSKEKSAQIVFASNVYNQTTEIGDEFI